MKGHGDEAADKKLFSKMIKKAMPTKTVKSHLKGDIKESKKSISKDKKLIKKV
jgi:hypothetical protein